MRARLQIALVGGVALMAAFAALLIATALTGSATWGWLAGAVGLLGILLVAVGGNIAIRRFIALSDRNATVSSNHQRRFENAAKADADTRQALDGIGQELEAFRADSARELEALRADAARELEALRSDATVEHQLRALEEHVAKIDRAVTVLRRRVPDGYLDPVRQDMTTLERSVHGALAELADRHQDEARRATARAEDSWTLGTEIAIQVGRNPRSFLTVGQATELLERRISDGELLKAAPLIRHYRGILARLDLATLRSLYRFYRSAGYWDLAATSMRHIAEKSGREGDRSALNALEREISVFSRPTGVIADVPPASAYSAEGPILHMVGRVLPDTQSGYTLRTHYTARAQTRRGIPVVVVGQSGIVKDEARFAIPYSLDGVDYFRLPGPLRRDVPMDDWLRHEIQSLAALVRRVRPSVLHAHSDFQNALIVHAVGTAYSIPTVYETRGFWEESWLTRTIAQQGWKRDADSHFATYGLPSAYSLRKDAEVVARGLVDRNVTLASVMKNHILESAQEPLREDDVSVVPNAVDSDGFPVRGRDPELAERIGIPSGAVTIGYISSMVGYESIETLIDAFHLVAERATVPVYLLLVGEGKHLESLRDHAKRGKHHAKIIFAGSVPHADIVTYYGLIDIFVVPRGKSSVADLVTPLKPFEAFASGCAVVLSDVAALREIAETSGAAETFIADYHRDLGRKLLALVNDPPRRRDLGVRGARWVRSERTWDRNVREYYRIYRELGYRGPADGALTGAAAPDQQGPASGRIIDQGGLDRSNPGKAADRAPAVEAAGVIEARPRAVVVAMKPQIAGRIRRNIITLLDLGFEVTVVNPSPRADFFQGLEHPLLATDFVDVKSMATRYQARMTRKMNERLVARHHEKIARQQGAGEREADLPSRMIAGVPGGRFLLEHWDSHEGVVARKNIEASLTAADKQWRKLVNATRTKRDLGIRNQLKKVHRVNRFVEFWWISPDRIAEHRPDLIVSSDLPGLVGANIAARHLAVPHLHDCHELYLESTTLTPYERRVLWPVEKAYLKRADSIVMVNETIRDEYEKRYGVRGTVLRNAAPAVPEEVRSNPVDLRTLAGLDREAKIVLYQGGLVPGRGIDVCVRAAQHFPENVHLVLIGKGGSLDELRDLARQLDVSDTVHFLPAVKPADLPAYTAGADLGVIPYQPVSRNNEYALPNKAFEYPGAGIPFVASDLPELRRIAETARCGEVYDPFDPAALAAAVRVVLDPDRYETYRQNADAFGRANTWETEREILVAEIRRLTGFRETE